MKTRGFMGEFTARFPVSVAAGLSLAVLLSPTLVDAKCGPTTDFVRVGVPTDSLELALSASKAAYDVGERVVVAIGLRSIRRQLVLMDTDAPFSYDVKVVNDQSQEVLTPKPSWDQFLEITRIGSILVDPNTWSVNCYDVTREYDLSKSGTYDITATRLETKELFTHDINGPSRELTRPVSNTVQVQVAEPSASR